MSAEERLAVHDVMHRYALGIDTKNWPLLRSVFSDEVTADFRSFGAKSVWSGSAEDWVTQVRSTIEGMDATQHLMSNHLYAVDAESARGTTYIQAVHVCRNDWGGDTYTIGGYYEVEMSSTPSGWRISRYTLQCTWHEGDRHVLRAAARRVLP
tara:strand:+ start:92 stop:550 length:459 start_codon:yes stop_codon:yes gene_type:complete